MLCIKLLTGRGYDSEPQFLLCEAGVADGLLDIWNVLLTLDVYIRYHADFQLFILFKFSCCT